jgi:catechol 2,3-dioxygenase-like lactoylglutathione lyase family enzyme
MKRQLLTLTVIAAMLTACGGEKEEEKEDENKEQPKDTTAVVDTPPVVQEEGGFTLGTNSVIAIGTEDAAASAEFYTKLGFHEVHKMDGEGDNPSIYMSDDNLMIALYQDGTGPYMGFAYFAGNFNEKVTKLKESNSVLFREWKEGETDMAVYMPPDSSTGIAIIGLDMEGMKRPTGTTFMDLMNEGKLQDASAYPNKKCGVFAEYAIPVKNLDEAMEYWRGLGFKGDKMSMGGEPYAILQDEFNTVGLHETTEFDYNAITFFAPDMEPYIKVLKEEGLEASIVQHEMGGNHYILTTPEGQKIFLFSMGM